jgi:hypothetical protein
MKYKRVEEDETVKSAVVDKLSGLGLYKLQ